MKEEQMNMSLEYQIEEIIGDGVCSCGECAKRVVEELLALMGGDREKEAVQHAIAEIDSEVEKLFSQINKGTGGGFIGELEDKHIAIANIKWMTNKVQQARVDWRKWINDFRGEYTYDALRGDKPDEIKHEDK